MNNVREHRWDSSVKRRIATQSPTAQPTVTSHEDMNIHRLQDLILKLWEC